MIPVYICSNGTSSGKTALALALAQRWGRAGVAVGYWKPLGRASSGLNDAAFAKDLLSLKEDVATLSPVVADDMHEYSRQIRVALDAVVEGKDVLIIEADGALDDDQAALHIRALRDAAPGLRVLHLARYDGDEVASRGAALRARCGDAFAGTIINAVPGAHEWFVHERVLADLADHGISVFGTLPQDRSIATMTVRELCSFLSAYVLAGESGPGLDETFESIMFGAMSAEDGLRYFGQMVHKLVVSRGDRPDVHLAALGTSTRCLLLTGGYPSYPFVLDCANERGIPVLSVSQDMRATIEQLEGLVAVARARNVGKIKRFGELLDSCVRWPELHTALGLALR